jgi:ABC-type transport system involved in multi-copper enzyme maturation permease subunit
MNALFPVVAIARNTFRETVRDRVLYAFVVFAFLLTLAGILLGSISVGQDLRILEDLGLATIAFIGGIIGIFVGTSLVHKEIERRTIYLIVTKPLSRWQFVTGKYIGLALCLLVVSVAMGGFLLGVVALLNPDHTVNPLMVEAVALIYVELLFVIAVATFFSTFATPLMSVVFTLAVWFIGHFALSLRDLGRLSTDPATTRFFDFVYWLMPDLASITKIRGDLMYGRQPELELLLFLCSYVLAYIVLLLSMATIVTERREFS